MLKAQVLVRELRLCVPHGKLHWTGLLRIPEIVVCIFFNLQSLPVNPTVLLWKTNKISEIEMLTLLCLFKIATLTHHFSSSSGEGHRHLNAKEIKKLSQRQVGMWQGDVGRCLGPRPQGALKDSLKKKSLVIFFKILLP